MKNKSRKILSILLMLFILSGTAWAQTRVATVDLRKLFDGYWKTQEAQKALKERAADFTKESNDLRDNLKTGNDDYKKLLMDANDQAVSSEERDKRKQAAEDKLKDLKKTEDTLKQFEQQARTSLEEQNRRMRDDIISEIRRVINARAKSAGYGIVLDSSAETGNATPVVVYNSGDSDLTDAVLSQLNANAPIEVKK